MDAPPKPTADDSRIGVPAHDRQSGQADEPTAVSQLAAVAQANSAAGRATATAAQANAAAGQATAAAAQANAAAGLAPAAAAQANGAAGRPTAAQANPAAGRATATAAQATATAKQAKYVVVTRAETDNGPLCSQLRELGLKVLLWPAVSVAIAETGPLDAAVENIQQFDWIVFASRYAVAAVIERLEVPPSSLRVAAVGQATGQVLRQRGWPVDLLPEDANAAALVSEFATKPMQGTKVLFPASSRALPTIAVGLTQLGATVTQVEAYRTEPASLDAEACRSWIERDAIGAVTFASPSAVIELEHSLGKANFGRLLAAAQVIAIGPTTARELGERGCTPVMAESATLGGLALTTFRSLQTRD